MYGKLFVEIQKVKDLRVIISSTMKYTDKVYSSLEKKLGFSYKNLITEYKTSCNLLVKLHDEYAIQF